MAGNVTDSPDKMGFEALFPSTNEMVDSWPLTMDGGVKLSELMISADIGQVHFFACGIGRPRGMCASCECFFAVLLIERLSMWLCRPHVASE
jgi:hypothetical protein